MLRWEPAISGYVITELNDVQWEANGLMDARNNPRRFADRLAALQTAWLVLARVRRTTVAGGESIDVEVRLAGAGEVPEGARIAWRFGSAHGEIAASASPTKFTIVAPPASGLFNLELEASDGDGRLLSHNRVEFCVVTPIDKAPMLFPLDEGAAHILATLRWPNVATTPNGATTLLATRLTTAARQRLLDGRHVLVVANSDDALVDPERRLPAFDRHNFPKMILRSRDGTPWDGRWMGAFCWHRTDGPWASLPGGAMIDEHWLGLTPNYVLTGFLSTAFAGLVDAGVVVAWVHHAAAFVKRSRLGAGWLTVTTFEFSAPAAAENPLAPHVLAAVARS